MHVSYVRGACERWTRGFSCKYVAEMSQTLVEFECTTRHACELRYRSSNDDEDVNVRYSFDPTSDRVRVWYETNN